MRKRKPKKRMVTNNINQADIISLCQEIRDSVDSSFDSRLRQWKVLKEQGIDYDLLEILKLQTVETISKYAIDIISQIFVSNMDAMKTSSIYANHQRISHLSIDILNNKIKDASGRNQRKGKKAN
jgi:hypothetical protein